MTAVIQNPAVDDDTQSVGLTEADVVMVGLTEFLQDPIGYGDYSFADPISLREFSTSRHMRGHYVAALT